MRLYFIFTKDDMDETEIIYSLTLEKALENIKKVRKDGGLTTTGQVFKTKNIELTKKGILHFANHLIAGTLIYDERVKNG